jgi:multiple sugar transport system substrate-binding protein
VTLNVSTFSAAYPKLLQQWLPEFEALTGAKVNFDTPSFPVYNQRADLELSTKGSAFDVVNVTFIYSSRWIGSGWLTPLDDYIRNTEHTPADWDVADFRTAPARPRPAATAALRHPLDRRGAGFGRVALRPGAAGRAGLSRHRR